MPKILQYTNEFKDQAVRFVFDSIAAKFGSTPETLRSWVRRVEVDKGCKPDESNLVRIWY